MQSGARGKNKKAIQAVLLLVSLGATGAKSESNPIRQPAFASSPDVIRAQIQSDVQGAIEKNRSSKTYGEYNTSGYTPADVFSNVRELRDPNSWAALCQTLDTLPLEQLALFEGEIDKYSRTTDSQTELPCAASLRGKLTKFWQESALRLRQHLSSLSGPSTPKSPKSQRSKTAAPKVHATECKISISQSSIVNRSQLKENEVALVFSDGPDANRTPRVLDILKATGVRATFFHIGEKIRANPQIDHRLVEERHTLGTQSFSHIDLTRADLKKADKQITEGRDEAEAASGVDAPLFRAPFGLVNDDIKAILKRKKMPLFQWDVDSLDWKLHDEVALYDHLIKTIVKDKGGIIPLHETEEASVAILRPLIDELRTKGFKFVVFGPCN